MNNRSYIKTRPCPSQLSSGSCSNKSCTYAHSIDELKHMECNFGDKCTKKDASCNFKHPSESVDDFRTRINFTPPLFLPSASTMDVENEPLPVVSGSVLPPFVLDMTDPMSHVVASMALLMKRDVKWVNE